MSRVVTQPTAPSARPTASPSLIPHDKIALRAYEKWVHRGRQHGSEEQDWIEAENELKSELMRSPSQKR